MLKDMLSKELIKLNLEASTKEEVIDELINLLFTNKKINDITEFKKAILLRESQSSTGLEEGIAIPHAKSNSVLSPCIVFGRVKSGINFDALDGNPSTLFFMIACPSQMNTLHIDTLSKLSALLIKDSIRAEILRSTSEEEILAILFSNESTVDFAPILKDNSNYDIVAVVGCPQGIAHTYMCANSFEVKAKHLGINLKIELVCPDETRNKLTDTDIKNAKSVIISANIPIDLARFKGKHLEILTLKEGTTRTEELLKNGMNQCFPIYN